MLQRPIHAFVALFAGLVMSLSAPALALGHGHAHHELHEHSVETHHGAAAGSLATAGEDSRHGGHEHGVVDPRLLSRFAQTIPAVTAPGIALNGFDALSMAAAVPPPVPAESPPDPVSTRPQQPRAPPVS